MFNLIGAWANAAPGAPAPPMKAIAAAAIEVQALPRVSLFPKQ